jgi:hypothetical protein
VLAAVAAAAALAGCGDASTSRAGHSASSTPSGSGSPTAAATPTAAETPGKWRAMAASPLSARHGAVAVVVDQEVLLIGGQDEPLCPPAADCATSPHRLRDGAAYHVARDDWRPVAPAPVGLALGTETAVVDGVVYVLVPSPDRERESTLLSYDPAADRWAPLAAPPRRGYLRLVAAGRGLIAYHSTHEFGTPQPDLAFDVGTGRWSDVPADPLVPAFDRTMVWAGDRLVLLAPRLVPQPGGADGPSWLRAATFDPASRTWRALPETQQVISGELTPVWTGQAVLNPTPGGADGGATNGYGRTIPFGGRLDLSTGRWTPLPPAPDRYRGWGVSAASPAYSAVGSVVLDAGADRWLPLPTPPDPPLLGHTAVWVANRLVVWGGGTSNESGSELRASGQVWTPSP